MEMKNVRAQQVNVQDGKFLHQMLRVNTFGNKSSLPKEKFTPLWHLPKLSKNFTGRDEELGRLEKIFSISQSMAIITHTQKVSGTGGVGKTQLAIKLAHRLAESRHFDVIIWLNHDLATEIRSLALSLDIKITGVSNAEIAKQTYQALCKMGKVLVIMDDVVRTDFIETYQPPADLNISVLLITRDATEWSNKIHQLALGVFTPPEAKEFINTALINNKCNDKYIEKDAELLAETVGYFPLALSHAVAYIMTPRGSIAQYISLFHSKRKSALSIAFENDSHAMCVWVTVNLCVEKITNSFFKQLLNASAYLAPEAAIPKTLLQDWLVDVEKDLKIDDALEVLCSLSLLEARDQNETYKIHQLVQDVLKVEETAELVQQRLVQWKKIIRSYNTLPPSNVTASLDEKKHVILKPHGVILAHQLSQQPRTDAFLEAEASLYILVGVAGKIQGEDQLFKSSSERALRCYRQRLSKQDDLNVGLVLMNLGCACISCGDLKKAKECFEASLPILKSIQGESHADIGMCLANLGSAVMMLGDPLSAKTHLETALPILKKNLGEKHVDVAGCMMNLASATMTCGDLVAAKALLETALPVLQSTLGERHSEVGRCMINLGGVTLSCGNPQGGREILEKALPILKSTLGERHTEVGTCLMNLGMATLACGNAQQAREYVEKALPILRENWGEQHPQVGQCLMNLGWVTVSCGDFQDGIKFLNTALPIIKTTLGERHADVGRCLTNLGTAYLCSDDLQEAKGHLENALPILQSTIGEHHPDVGRCLMNLANVYLFSGDSLGAKTIMQDTMPILITALGEQSAEVGQGLVVLGNAALLCGYPRRAMRQLEKSLLILQTTLGNNHPHVTTCQTYLSQAIEQCVAQPEIDNPAKAIRKAAASQSVSDLRNLLEDYDDYANVPDQTPNQGFTALHWAVMKQRPDHVHVLLECIGFTAVKDAKQCTALDYALIDNDPKMLEIFCNALIKCYLKYGVDRTQLPKLVRLCANFANEAGLKLLIHLKVPIDVCGVNTGESALHFAVINGYKECVKLLMAAGADPYLAALNGQTPLSLAENKENNWELIELLTIERRELTKM